jgi:hypothetical protein
METPSKSRSRGRVVLAVVFVLLASSAWWQVIADLFLGNASPPLLTGLQLIVGAMAAGAAWGSWIGARWASLFAVLYGVIAGGMVTSIGRILDLGADERRGLWLGGAIVLVFGLVTAWWLRRTFERERARAASHIVGFD